MREGVCAAEKMTARLHVGVGIAAERVVVGGKPAQHGLVGAEAVGIHLSIRVFIVLGPLLFLVMLVPFTVNGLAVREAFFVDFLGRLDVGADPAFATGFLFSVMTLVLAAPGLAVVLWESIRRAPVSVTDG